MHFMRDNRCQRDMVRDFEAISHSSNEDIFEFHGCQAGDAGDGAGSTGTARSLPSTNTKPGCQFLEDSFLVKGGHAKVPAN